MLNRCMQANAHRVIVSRYVSTVYLECWHHNSFPPVNSDCCSSHRFMTYVPLSLNRPFHRVGESQVHRVGAFSSRLQANQNLAPPAISEHRNQIRIVISYPVSDHYANFLQCHAGLTGLEAVIWTDDSRHQPVCSTCEKHPVYLKVYTLFSPILGI